MNPIESLFSESFGHALGWTLLHFVWQGALVALLLAGVLYLLRRRTAQVRYAVSCGALVLLLVLPVLTLSLLLPTPVDDAVGAPLLAQEAAESTETTITPEAPPAALLDTKASWQQEAAAMMNTGVVKGL